MASSFIEDRQDLLQFALDCARTHGATAADALFVEGHSTSIGVRLGNTEKVKQSRNKGLGLRVFSGQRSATTSTSDLSKAGLESLIARTCAAAKVTAADDMAGLPDRTMYNADKPEELELADPTLVDLGVDDAIEMAKQCEAASLEVDPRITNSEGAEMSWGLSETFFANSLGITRQKKSGSIGFWTAPVAEHSGGMERDYWYTSARHLADLESPADVGREASRRTLRRLDARQPKTCEIPIIYEWTVASSLLGALAGALTGGAVYRQASYLAGKLGETIASPLVQITDDACIVRGAGSKSYDGEGLATQRTTVVKDGVLQSYLLDTYSARKLGLKTTRNAARSLGGTPAASATNFWMAPGELTLDELELWEVSITTSHSSHLR